MKKRVLFLLDDIWSIGKNMGASSTYRLLLKSDIEFQSTIITSTKGDYQNELPNSKILFYKKINARNCNRYIKFIISFINYLLTNFLLFFRIIFRKDHFDLIYCSSSTPAVAGLLLKKKFNIPLIIRLYGTFLYGKTDTFIDKLKNWQEVLAFKIRADKFIITNDGTKGDLVAEQFGIEKRKLSFLRNGVDKAHAENKESFQLKIRELYGLHPTDFIILSVSRLVDWKRLDRSIKAINQIDLENIKFFIVGDGPMFDEYKKIATNLNIKFLGPKTLDEVREIMFASDLFISTYDISNIGNPLLEAMSAGLPIITINTGDTASIINKDNGVLIDYKNENEMIKEIYSEILNLYYDVDRRKELAKAALDYSENQILSWKERIDLEIELLKECINEKDISTNGRVRG